MIAWHLTEFGFCSRPGDIVFDPFIGSGTTAVAAKRLGRRFLGCDIKPEYVKIAEERLKNCTAGTAKQSLTLSPKMKQSETTQGKSGL